MTREEIKDFCDMKAQLEPENEDIYKAIVKALEQELTTKNDLAVDCIDRVELLKAMNTYDKFGNDSNERLIFLSTPALQDRYVPYVHYDEMVNCVKGMPTVTPQQPKTGYISIDDVMSVFDDFMCGEVDEEGTETFWEMLKDKAESENK